MNFQAKPNEIEAKLNNGLVKGHAYTVTGVKKVDLINQPSTNFSYDCRDNFA